MKSINYGGAFLFSTILNTTNDPHQVMTYSYVCCLLIQPQLTVSYTSLLHQGKSDES